jgi:hypothetical protein
VPFDRDNDVDKLWAHVHESPPALLDARPHLPSGLGPVIDRALAKDATERPPSAGELMRAAQAAL